MKQRIADLLVNHGNSIYIATRLYDYSQKLQAEELEETVIRALIDVTNIKQFDTSVTFVPFRDINEDRLVSEDKALTIFQKDIKRLSTDILGLVGIYNDISKDDGIAFEIGYLYAHSIPIFLLNTDFIWYRLIKEQEEFIYDPIITNMANSTEHYYQIPTTSDIFKERLLEGFNNALSIVFEKLKTFFNSDAGSIGDRTVVDLKVTPGKVYIDFGGGRCEYQREYAERLASAIRGYAPEVSVGSRFASGDVPFKTRISDDMRNFEEAEIYIFSADEPEIDSGSAALAGYAYATGKEILMYYSGNIEILGDGNQRMRKNLMVECACTDVLFSFDALIERTLRSLRERSVS